MACHVFLSAPNFAKLLRRKHSRDLADEERGYIADLASMKNRIKQLEVQPSKQCTRRNLRSCHLEVRWFKVRDYVKNGLLNVLHLRTQYNLADYFTKPLLGNHFQKFRDCIMGVEPETSYFMMPLIKLQSRPITIECTLALKLSRWLVFST